MVLALGASGLVYVILILVLPALGDSRRAAPESALAIGSFIRGSADIDYKVSDLTVLVGLSSTCRSCAESMPAFQKLNEVARSSTPARIQVLALDFEPRYVLAKYLSGNGLTAFQPISIRPDSEMVPAVARAPTLVLVDRSGRVLASWTGRRMTAEQMVHVVTLHHIGLPLPRE